MSLLGNIVGGVLGIGGSLLSKPKKPKDPNAYLTPYLRQGAGAAQSLFQQGGPNLWDESTIAPMSDATRGALDAHIARGQNGSPLIDQAQGFVQSGLQQPISTQFGNAQNPYARSVGGGAQFNPYANTQNPFGQGQNPGLDAAFDHMAQKTQNATASEFARAGRNIGASAPVRADILSNLAAQIYAPAYESERNRELAYGQQQLGIGAQGFESGQDRSLQARLSGQNIGAQGFENSQSRALADLTAQRGNQTNLLGFATPLAAQDYMDLQAQREAAGQYDSQAQAQLSDQVSRYNQNALQPYANLDDFLSRLNGLKSATGPAMAPTQNPNYLAAGLGGALAARELFPGAAPKASPAPAAGGYGNFSLLGPTGQVPSNFLSMWGP